MRLSFVTLLSVVSVSLSTPLVPRALPEPISGATARSQLAERTDVLASNLSSLTVFEF
jgi:hypothetical protein